MSGPDRNTNTITMLPTRPLGRTGVQVSCLALGTLTFGGWGNRDPQESIRIIHAALDAGINMIDTADFYALGEAEEIVGRALAGGRRDDVVLATKVTFPMGDDVNRRGSSRRWIMREVENSLRRLRTDWIDVYQIHRFDPETDLDETLGALTDLVRAGKVRYLGSSAFPPETIVEAQWVAERRSRERFICEQTPYSLLVRGVEAHVLPTCARYGMGTVTYGPLAAGWLTGQKDPGAPIDDAPRGEHIHDASRPAHQRKREAVRALTELAKEAGIGIVDLALAFVIRHPAVTAAIVGPSTIEHLQASLNAVSVHLDNAILDRIDEVVPPGTNVDPADEGWANPALDPQARRRT
jgi:aryl-alcohol dehydrogenase-like predicted oxidoreductase